MPKKSCRWNRWVALYGTSNLAESLGEAANCGVSSVNTVYAVTESNKHLSEYKISNAYQRIQLVLDNEGYCQRYALAPMRFIEHTLRYLEQTLPYKIWPYKLASQTKAPICILAWGPLNSIKLEAKHECRNPMGMLTECGCSTSTEKAYLSLLSPREKETGQDQYLLSPHNSIIRL